MDKFIQWLRNLAGSHIDLVEATHQLRVTSRRADVALRVFKDWLPHDRRLAMRRILKEIRFDAGIIRDLDLLEAKWRPSHGTLAGQASVNVAIWMHQQILQQRDHARCELAHWTRRSRRCRLEKRSKGLIRQVRPRGSPTATACLSKALEKLIDRLNGLLPRTALSLHDSHQTRIAARRLRYALELLHPFLAGEVAGLIKLLTHLQDHLGAINDDATAIQHLMTLMEACHEPSLLPELQQQLERNQLLAAERLAHWQADMPARLEQIGEHLRSLQVK